MHFFLVQTHDFVVQPNLPRQPLCTRLCNCVSHFFFTQHNLKL